MLSDEELRAIEERVGAATPGPWEVEHDIRPDIYTTQAGWGYNEEGQIVRALHKGASSSTGRLHIAEFAKYYGTHQGNLDDAEFIAHAREDIPQLLAEVRRLQGELARYKWTRVEDGLPEEQGVYDARIRDTKGGTRRAWIPFYLSLYPGDLTPIKPTPYWSGLLADEEVTHWMHIPPVEGE